MSRFSLPFLSLFTVACPVRSAGIGQDYSPHPCGQVPQLRAGAHFRRRAFALRDTME